MNKIHKTEIHGPWMGAINQMYTIVTNIIYCIDNNKNICVCGNFLNEIYSDKTTPISNILDLPKINDFLYEKYKIIMVDVNDVKFKIFNVSYGNHHLNIDITDSILEKYKYHDNRFIIPKQINLNSLKGDPIVGEPKKVFIK